MIAAVLVASVTTTVASLPDIERFVRTPLLDARGSDVRRGHTGFPERLLRDALAARVDHDRDVLGLWTGNGV